jgi:hypothetical protein
VRLRSALLLSWSMILPSDIWPVNSRHDLAHGAGATLPRVVDLDAPCRQHARAITRVARSFVRCSSAVMAFRLGGRRRLSR